MAEPAITQDEHALKQRAMRRLTIALSLIAAAIITLAVLDRYHSSPKKTAVPAGPPEPALPPAAEPPPRTLPPRPSDESREARPPPPPAVVENQPPPTAVGAPRSLAEAAAKQQPSSPGQLGALEKSGSALTEQQPVAASAANARALQNKLAETGIPTHTETRLVVGPFKHRAEAEGVIHELKMLGVEGVVVAPPAAQ
jgi:DedD protein